MLPTHNGTMAHALSFPYIGPTQLYFPAAALSVAPREIKIGSRRIKLPASRIARLGLGGALIAGGVVGFLPVLGFWMIPLGLLVLSYDVPAARRMRRKLSVWWSRSNGQPNAKARNEQARACENRDTDDGPRE